MDCPHTRHGKLSIDAGHASLPGHFPGNPIVPGVVILNLVLETLQQQNPSLEIDGIKKLKFMQPLMPGQEFKLEHADVRNNGIRFKCLLCSDNSILAEGHLKLADSGNP